MYNLIKLSLHNWYVIDAQDIPIFKNTAIIGQTGAGKSSILDAIQTIISGNNRNIIELNAAAGEKRGRTVKDYILGKVSDFNEGKPRRDNCESTIVMTMYDESKNKFLCLGLMFQASEETNEKTKRFIIEDYDFSIEDFISKDETVLSHKEIISIIEKDNYNIEFYSNSIKFVSAYLEKVRPVLTPNPKHFLRSFSNTLQAKEISNPTEFVRKFVLEPIDLNITGIRKSIQNWKELSQEVENIETKIIEISEIYNDYQKAFKFSIENLLYKEENLKKKINQENSSILNFENILLDAESELDLLKKEKNELKSKLSNTQFNHNSIDLKNNINTLKNNLSFLLPSFSKEEMDFISKIGFNFNPNLIEKNSYNQLKDLNELLNNSIEESYKEEKEIKSKLEYNNNLLDSYKNNESIYSKHTKQFMELLDVNNIYYINVIDTISIINNKWSDALEILLGLNKEAFLFKNDSNEKKAFNILEKYKSNLFKVRIISNIKLDNLTEVEVSKHSISNFLEYENKQIEKFIKHQIGYFIATEKYEDLNKLKYAIMPSGKSTSGLIKRVHSQPMKQIKQKDLSDINISDLEDTIEKQKIEFNTISNRKNLINICFQKIKQIKDNFEAILDTQNQIEKFEINNKKTEKEQNNNNFEKLQNDLENIQEKINSKDVTILMNKEKIEQSKINIKNIEAELLKIIQEKESDKYKFYSDLLKNINTTFDNNIKTPHKDETIFNIFQNANTKLMKFSQKWIVEVPLSDNSTNIERLQWISEESDKLINSELRQYRERLIKAKEEMETALKSGLLSQLLESFETLEQQLNNLNNRLYKYSFVGQKYIFKKTPNHFMSPVIMIVESLKKNKNFSFENIESDKTLNEGIQFIEDMISDENTEMKFFEDYRNYFEFELYIEHEDPKNPSRIVSTPFSSVMGILSGGQRQAPYYVAIAASMVNTYYPKSSDNDFEGMGILAFDEAFNKLDIPNTQRLMSLFKNLGLQVIVAAPEEKRSSLIESVDSIISVSRIPGTDNVFIDSVKIGKKAKKEMLEQNPIHRLEK